jgi:hypothetical protein
MHPGDGFLEFFEREMPFAAVGEELVSLVKIFVDECKLREFDGAPSGEGFIMLDRPGAARQRKQHGRYAKIGKKPFSKSRPGTFCRYNCCLLPHLLPFRKPAFLLQFFCDAVDHQILGFETSDFFIVCSQQTNDIVHPIDTRIDFPFIKIRQALVTFFCVVGSRQPHAFYEALENLRLVGRIPNKIHAIE